MPKILPKGEAPPAKTESVFSEIRVSVYAKDSLMGFASVKVGGAFYVTGLRIVNGKKGPFVSMPQKKGSDGEYSDIAFPASKAHRDELQALVLAAYESAE